MLSVPDLRPLLFVGFISFVVRWLETLAMALFAYRATGSAFIVAMLTMLRVLPMGLFGAFIGAAADRFSPRSALILGVAASMASTLVLAVLASLGLLQVWHLAVACFVNGINWATDNPVRRMMIGNAVGTDRMGQAISLDVAANNASRVLGPALAGVLLARYDMASVFWLGVLMYGISLVAALSVQKRGARPAAGADSMVGAIRKGFAWLRHDQRLVGVLVITVIFNIFGWSYTSMVPVIATGYFRLDPGGAGLMAGCEGAGGLIGAVLFARLGRTEWYGRTFLAATILYFATIMSFAMAPGVPLAVLLLLVNGIGGVGFAVMQATLVYRYSPADMRGRLLGVLSVCIGAGPIGFMYLGFLADVLTPRAATLAIALQGMLALVLTRRYWTPLLRG